MTTSTSAPPSIRGTMKKSQTPPTSLPASVILIALVSAFLVASCHAQQEVTVRHVDMDRASMYPGITAAQGLLIPGDGVEINCMHSPLLQSTNSNQSTSLPRDNNICRIPNYLSAMSESKRESLQVADTHPICFVVSGNETSSCPLEQQVKQAQLIQDRISDRVKCLIVYGNSPDIYDLNIKDYSIAVIYIPALSGEDLLMRMEQFATDTNKSSFFFDPSGDNVDWNFSYQVLPYGGPGNFYDGGADNFFWFRIVLFTLLIVSPCLRAAYLWYAGGGRIHVRRNENGRLIGLQVVPPMPHWLSSGVIIRPSEPVSTILTEERFNSLPTTTYQQSGPKSEHSGESRPDDLDSTENDTEAPTDLPVTDISGSLIDDLEQAQAADNDVTSPSDATGATQPSPITTSCTLCSICIDDFEAGETILVLPRCQHAFHRDCIHPWLTERQGCCPLCKTNVFEQQEDSLREHSASHEDGRVDHPVDDVPGEATSTYDDGRLRTNP